MLKRGQTQQIFVWILVLVVAASILFFGIKLIKKSEALKDEVLVIDFFNKLDKKLSQYYYLDKGSSGEEKFLLPSDVKEVCFINPNINGVNDFTNSNVEDKEKNYFFQLREFSNVFVMPNTLYDNNRYNLITKFSIDNNPECVNVVNGVLNINLLNDGITNGVRITEV